MAPLLQQKRDMVLVLVVSVAVTGYCVRETWSWLCGAPADGDGRGV